MQWVKRFAPVVAAVSLAAAATLADAGISYVSQERRVLADTGDLGIPEEGGPDFGTERQQERSASGFGVFDESVTSTYLQVPDNDFQEAKASQRSQLTAGGITAAGSLSARSADEATRFETVVRAVFDLDADTPYSLLATIDQDQNGIVGSRSVDPDAEIIFVRLARLDGGGSTVVNEVYTPRDTLPFGREPGGPVSLEGDVRVASEGTLPAGRYELLFEYDDTTSFLDRSADYRLDFAIDGGSGGGNPVPLPPAAWAGLLTMGGAGLVRLARRRLRRDDA